MQRLNRKSKCEQENLKVASLSIKKKITMLTKKDLISDKPKGYLFSKTGSQNVVSLRCNSFIWELVRNEKPQRVRG